ncbi:MAG: hypothetical protein JNN00_03500 [Chitinophagaceae bacterium]|nr:hypothetical protein [Chitinophagaceae bacterium]
MLVAKKVLTSSPLSIVKSTIHSVSPESVNALPISTKIPATETKPDLDHLPFEKWNIPNQERGYIKGRENDFL